MTHARRSRRLTALAALTALTLGALGTTPAGAAPPGDAEDLLASLDADQLAALTRLQELQVSGLQDFDEDATESAEPVDVVVALTQPTAETARLLAATDGGTLSPRAAADAVEESQDEFDAALAEEFPAPEKRAKGAEDVVPVVTETYTGAFNGASLTVRGTDLEALAALEGVAAVWPDAEVHATSTAPSVAGVAGAPADPTDDQAVIAAGLARLHAEGVTGAGITVGVIDTGIDYHHPDLADAYVGGYDFVDDDADPMETTWADWKASGRAETSNGSVYYTEHGTHVAGIVAGRGDVDDERAAHGVAPGAKIRAYRVLGPYGSGYTSDVLAGMDGALQDEVDVVNMSLGASSNDSLTPQSLAADNLVLAGVTTVIAAGNDGPDPQTLGTPGAAALPITVGANDTPLTLSRSTAVLGDVTAEVRLLASSAQDPTGTHVPADLGVVAVGLGNAAGYAGKDVAGKVVLVDRGSISLNEKVERARDRGAAAVLLVNDVAAEGWIPNYLGEGPGFVPAFSVTAADGAALKAALAADAAARVTLSPAGEFVLGGDQVAAFSSRGPVYGSGTIKPEITAPGVSILSSVPVDVVDPEGRDYGLAHARLSGTSMASPYVAGVAALLLDDDPRRTPADVKVALMNTAAPLERTDDVFAAGAGQVDPWAAVHADVSARASLETPQVDAAGATSVLRHDTGAVDFGTLPAGRRVQEKVTVTLTGGPAAGTRYDVRVEQVDADGPDAAANGVRVEVPSSVRVGRGGTPLQVRLTAPDTAAEGLYQAVVTLTPQDPERPALRLPVGARLATNGLAEIAMLKPTLSTHQGTGAGLAANGQAEFAFRLDGELRELRVFLADERGTDVGYIGTLSTIGLQEDVLYGTVSVNGSYFPLTGDPRNPVSPTATWAAEGAYRLKVVGVDADDVTSTRTTPIYVDTTAPTYEDAFGAWDLTSPTVVERPAGAAGYRFDGHLTDPSVEAVRAAGIDLDQTDNQLLWSVYNPQLPESQARPDASGAVSGTITFPVGAPVTTMFMWPTDAAGNFGERRKVSFIKAGLPYVVGSVDTGRAKVGDVVTYTLTAHDLADTTSFSTEIRYSTTTAKNVTVTPTPELVALDPSALRTVPGGSGTYPTATTSFDLPAPLTADETPLLTVSFEVADSALWSLENGIFTGTTTVTDSTGRKAGVQQFYGAVERFNPRSRVSGRVAPEALLTKTYAFDQAADYTAYGTEVTLTAPDGTVTEGTVDGTSRYVFDGLALTDEPYELEIRVPGHFTWHRGVAGGTARTGGAIVSQVPALSAGDVNGDDVIDVRDAVAIRDAAGTSERAADVDGSGTVDRRDLAWVRANYLEQNSTVQDVTTPVTRYRGLTLEDVERQM